MASKPEPRCWCDEWEDSLPAQPRDFSIDFMNHICPASKKVQSQPIFPPETARFPNQSASTYVKNLLKVQDEFVVVLQATANQRSPGPIFHALLPRGKRGLNSVFAAPMGNKVARIVESCSACCEFVNKYGDLCTIDEDGTLVPVFWPRNLEFVPQHYQSSVKTMLAAFAGCIAGDEYNLGAEKDRILGYSRGRNPKYRHLHVVLDGGPLTGGSKDGLDTKTSSAMLTRVLNDYDRETVIHTQHLIYEKLPYAAPHRPVIDYLEGVLGATGHVLDQTKKRNLIIKFSRTAWPGCLSSLRGGIVGQLLSDVAAGHEYKDIVGRWTSLADPLVYLRSTSDPSAGNISQAEQIFRNLGYSKQDLIRYFMTVDQIPESAIFWTNTAIWARNAQPSASVSPESPKIFSSLQGKDPGKLNQDLSPKSEAKAISFRAFALHVLPSAKALEVYLEPEERLAFFTTGAPKSNPPFSFGSMTNSASWYHWNKPLPVSKANMKPGWNTVAGVISFPHMWEHLSAAEGIDYDQQASATDPAESELENPKQYWPHARHGSRYMFCIQDAKETRRMGASLFPAIIRGEFHCVRKTIEAFSKEEQIREPLGPGTHYVGGVTGGSHRWSEVFVRCTQSGMVYNISLFD